MKFRTLERAIQYLQRTVLVPTPCKGGVRDGKPCGETVLLPQHGTRVCPTCFRRLPLETSFSHDRREEMHRTYDCLDCNKRKCTISDCTHRTDTDFIDSMRQSLETAKTEGGWIGIGRYKGFQNREEALNAARAFAYGVEVLRRGTHLDMWLHYQDRLVPTEVKGIGDTYHDGQKQLLTWLEQAGLPICTPRSQTRHLPTKKVREDD